MTNKRKIGPGVYTVGPLGEIEMDPEVIQSRHERGLPVPDRYIPDPRTDAERIEDQEYEDYQDTIDSLLVELRPV